MPRIRRPSPVILLAAILACPWGFTPWDSRPEVERAATINAPIHVRPHGPRQESPDAVNLALDDIDEDDSAHVQRMVDRLVGSTTGLPALTTPATIPPSVVRSLALSRPPSLLRSPLRC